VRGGDDVLQFDVHEPARASVYLPDESATLQLGLQLGHALQPRLIVYLRGELGAGKTTVARGALRGLGYAQKVRSPTFTLVEVYQLSSLYLHHFDFYRFKHPSEWVDAGFREMFEGDSVCLVEWPEKVGALLPPADLELCLMHEENGRRAWVFARTEAGTTCMRRLIAQ
jgi:tRNA threonylcarbamoyladenosine biosynthesis protein TsaE